MVLLCVILHRFIAYFNILDCGILKGGFLWIKCFVFFLDLMDELSTKPFFLMPVDSNFMMCFFSDEHWSQKEIFSHSPLNSCWCCFIYQCTQIISKNLLVGTELYLYIINTNIKAVVYKFGNWCKIWQIFKKCSTCVEVLLLSYGLWKVNI